MSIGHHIQPVQNDSNSKLNEEHLYLKYLLSSVDRQVEHDNKHESLHQLLTLVKNKMVMNQTKVRRESSIVPVNDSTVSLK